MLAGYRQVYHEDSVQEAGDRQVALQAHWEEAQAKSDDGRAGEGPGGRGGRRDLAN